MKKFLTVLLVIAVMFTFSFGTSFAAIGDAGTYVDNEAAARTYIADEVKDLREAIATSFDKEEADAKAALKTAPYELAAYLEKLAELESKINAGVNKQLAKVYEKFDAAIAEAAAADETILGYVVAASGSTANDDYYESKYVDVYEILTDYMTETLVIKAVKNGATATVIYDDFIDEWFTDEKADYVELTFKKAVAGTIDNLNKIDLTVVSDKVNAYAANTTVTADGTFGTSEFNQSFSVKIDAGTTDYAAAVKIREALVAYLGGLDPETDNQASTAPAVTTNFLKVYELDYPGTADEKVGGWFGDMIGTTWNTTTQETVKGSVVDYAKTEFKAYVLGAIQKEWNDTVGAQKQIIWEQNLLAKPNAATIKAAEERIEAANKKYEAVTEVWTYVVENAEYYVSSGKVFLGWDENADGDYVDADEWTYSFATYDGTTFAMTPASTQLNNGDTTFADIEGVVTELSSANCDLIVKNIVKLNEKAEAYKANIAVDGDKYLVEDIEEALADAIKACYMGDVDEDFTVNLESGLLHARQHKLIDTGAAIKVSGKEYEPVTDWDETLSASWGATGYTKKNVAAVKAIKKEAIAAVKAAATIADAEAAFLAGYEKWDAVVTEPEHAKMFQYGGVLYSLIGDAQDDVEAYIDYKIGLMGTDADASAETKLKAYLSDTNTGIIFTEVYSAEDLTAKVAEAKAFVDAVKTTKALTAEENELIARAVAVKSPVTLAAKDEIIQLYRDIDAFATYAGRVGYTATVSTSYLVNGYVATLADLEEAAMKDIVKEVFADDKVTLEDKAKVDELSAAAKAYEDLYVLDLETEVSIPASLTTETGYNTATVAQLKAKIWQLRVDAVKALIRALPVDATPKQVSEARAALEDLGWAGLCAFEGADSVLLTKLNKFEQDTIGNEENAKAYVQDLSIKARSTKTSKGVKVTIKADVQPLLDAGFTVEYKFYRSTKSNKNFKAMVTKTTGTYTNTKGVKGTKYYYKAKLVVKNAAGEVVATTPLTQCLYATRTF